MGCYTSAAALLNISIFCIREDLQFVWRSNALRINRRLLHRKCAATDEKLLVNI
jgi:hypothetical protein